ncbi:helix-turn-helix domain-containing protein [Endozoicomonas sp. GU-1]|uniref:helix-turn-helix domain-containing protein n=1 Tax=Endozoicomonas sp. GU-1 TaxID=3009078 RepID=UPI0022B42ACB|nr:helix-turn-helix domain-containing protein [Endozoicomonas sp. GU-1]WBA79580.1 helix-turn-helix domain-containing protein [Endozoicomonas sp. GU-1]
MSVKLMSKVWRMTVPTTEKIVLLALADWASDDGVAYPRQCTLAIKCSLAERTIRKTLKALRDEYSLVEWEQRGAETGNRSNTYFLLFASEEDQPIVVEKKERLKRATGNKKPETRPKTKPLSQLTTYPDQLNYEAWISWLEYKRDEHRFTFKTEKTELTAINKLIKDTSGNQQMQADWIENSIANGYKGIFGGRNVNSNNAAADQASYFDQLNERVF